MRIIFKLLLLLLPLHTSAQQYQSIEGLEERAGLEKGIYYKDLNNVFDGFLGTYEYAGTDFYFKIVLKRKNASNVSDYFWEDIIVGGYQYIKGEQDINYLQVEPANILNGMRDVNLWAGSIFDETSTFCQDCLPGKWVMGAVRDPIRKKSGLLYIAKKVQNGVNGLQLWIRLEAGTQQSWESEEPIQVPTGRIFMKKID